jgi:hypothetical protein
METPILRKIVSNASTSALGDLGVKRSGKGEVAGPIDAVPAVTRI